MKNYITFIMIIALWGCSSPATFENSHRNDSQSANRCDYVDLGLPSGTLWATCNVGANNPWEHGDHFAWGEVVPKEHYDWESYKWWNADDKVLTKYVSSTNEYLEELNSEDDAATVIMGEEWCMPSSQQMSELTSKKFTTCEKTTIHGVSGRKFTSKINGNSVFLPLAGSGYLDSIIEKNEAGCYWTRTCYSNKVSGIYIKIGNKHIPICNQFGRCYGFSVRPVRRTTNVENIDR